MVLRIIKKLNWNCQFLHLKNPKCFDDTGNLKANLYNSNADTSTAMALVSQENSNTNFTKKVTNWFKKKLWTQ